MLLRKNRKKTWREKIKGWKKQLLEGWIKTWKKIHESLKKKKKFFLWVLVWIAIVTVFLYFDIWNWVFPIVQKKHSECSYELLRDISVLVIASLTIYMTNRRIKKQTEANKIAQDSSTDQTFSNAIRHLGSKSPQQRIGGILTLHSIARSDPKNRAKDVLDIFKGYMQGETKERVKKEKQEETDSGIKNNREPVSPETEKIFQLIFDKKNRENIYQNVCIRTQPVFSNTNLRSAPLTNLDLREAELRGADLRRTDLIGAKLIEAKLSIADLRGADLREIKNANIEQFLEVSTLYGAQLDPDLEEKLRTVKPELFEKPLYLLRSGRRIGESL